MYDVIIIGGGPGGITASIYANRAGLKSVIIEKLFLGGQIANTYEVDNYPGIEDISGIDLIMKFDSHAKKFNSTIINEEITEICVEDKIKVVRTTNTEYKAKTIIIATGAKPRRLNVPGEDSFSGRGVSYCATCDGAFYRGKDVAVIGGGNTAIEDAIFLSRICKKVYVVHRRDTFRADKSMVNNLLKASNVEIIYDSVLETIEGENTVNSIMVQNLKTNDKRKLEISGVFIAVGIVPSSEIAKGVLELDDMGAIITNKHMQTNIEGVYAVGDVRNTPLRQIITAASDGAIAAYEASLYIANE